MHVWYELLWLIGPRIAAVVVAVAVLALIAILLVLVSEWSEATPDRLNARLSALWSLLVRELYPDYAAPFGASDQLVAITVPPCETVAATGEPGDVFEPFEELIALEWLWSRAASEETDATSI